MPRTLPNAAIGFWLAFLSAVILGLSPIGYRLGWWDFHIALLYLVSAGVIVAVVALVVSLVTAFRAQHNGRTSLALAVAGIALSLGAAALPVIQIIKSRDVPRIHDISTDTENPPRFVALAKIREATLNGLEYEGAEIARQQRQGYPEITPYRSSLPPDQLFTKAGALAHEIGWQIAAAVPAEGRIEATDRTLLYGFKDDVVIRITPAARGSQLDIRSMSRVGLSDMGANAARIRKFFTRLQESGA
jgi:hypothetical protein